MMMNAGDRRSSMSGVLFSNQAAINGDRYDRTQQQQQQHSKHASFIDDVSPQQPAKESVVMRNKVIDLDKNRIKCGRSKLWSRPLSFSGFFKKSLSQGSIQLTGGKSGGCVGPGEGGGVRHSTNYAVNHGRDPNGNEPPPSGRSAKLDLNMIRKLEEEIYKRGRELQRDECNAEAKDFHDFYFSQRTTFGEKKTFSSETSAYKGDGRALLLVDSQALEPMLLKRPLSTDDALLQQQQNGSEEHVADVSNKSIIIVDNSEFYPVLMRYDINSELVNRQMKEQEARKRNEEKLKITTQNGGFPSSKTVTTSGPNASLTSSNNNNSGHTKIRLSSSNLTTAKDPPALRAKTTRDESVACCETNNNNHSAQLWHRQQQKKLVVSGNSKPPPPAGSGSGDRAAAKKTRSNLFQRFLLQRRSLNLSVRRRRRHECHFRPPPGYPMYSSSTESSLPGSPKPNLPAGNNKLKFEYLKKMQRYDPETQPLTLPIPHLMPTRTTSEPDLYSRANWKSEHFLQHLQHGSSSWSTGDLDSLDFLMSSSKTFENIFESASDNLSRLSAVVISSSSSHRSPSSSGSLTSSSSHSSSHRGSRMQSILLNHYHFLQSRERSGNKGFSAVITKPPPLGGNGTTQPASGNFLRKKSSSFRGVLKRTNKPDVVNTWIYRKR